MKTLKGFMVKNRKQAKPILLIFFTLNIKISIQH
ncbi:MAG: hypothetical protein K0R36_309 [Chryseobacterium sp.]|jgi:hypothetical protein|nr:hypothetical protein [Chryseobacterium sp.]